MYSYEISELLTRSNYRIPSDVYWKICESPQVCRVKYNPYGDCIEIWTSDGKLLFMSKRKNCLKRSN